MSDKSSDKTFGALHQCTILIYCLFGTKRAIIINNQLCNINKIRLNDGIQQYIIKI